MKIQNPFKKRSWAETVTELENRSVLVTQEKEALAARCRILALPFEAGDSAAVKEMKGLADQQHELSRRLVTINDARDAAGAGLEAEQAEAARLAEVARRAEILALEERIYKMLDQTDAAMKAAGEAVAALQAEAVRMQSLVPHHALYRSLGRGSGAIFGALKYHGFLDVIQRGNPRFPRRPLSAMKNLSAGFQDEPGEVESDSDAAADPDAA